MEENSQTTGNVAAVNSPPHPELGLGPAVRQHPRQQQEHATTIEWRPNIRSENHWWMAAVRETGSCSLLVQLWWGQAAPPEFVAIKNVFFVYWHWSQDASIFSCVSLLIDVRGRRLSKQPVCGGWGMFVLLSQQEAWWESSRVTAGWGFVAVVWQGVASTDPTDCWFNNSSNNQSLGLCVPFTEDNFNQAWLSCWCS